MDVVAKRFINCIQREDMPVSKMIFDMSIYKNDSKYSYFCIVEGKTDVLFYKNINIIPFREKNVAFIYKDYIKNDDYSGKKAVIHAFKRFGKHFAHDMRRCLFIVDHDYDGLDCRRYGLSELARKYINVLPVYSFENYFLNQKNMFLVLDRAGLPMKEAIMVNKAIMNIKEETIDFFACKCVITVKSQEDKYKKLRSIMNKFNESDLFKLNIKQDPPLRYSYILFESGRMKDVIFEISDLKAYFNKVREKLLEDNDNRYVKGKVIFWLLRDYIRQLAGIDISESNVDLYEKIVSEIEIDLNPVFARVIQGVND